MNVENILQKLHESQYLFIEKIRPFSAKQDWRLDPDEWSFREVAAHMSTTEEECFKVRLFLIANNRNPHFEYYLNSNRDFSQLDLNDSLEKWIAVRQEIFDYLKKLPEVAWQFTGHHTTFGHITLSAVLQIMLDHDQGHIAEMESMISTKTAQ